MGVGDKLFPVPLNALTLDTVNKTFTLNRNKESLKNAPGFDKNNYPDMTDHGAATCTSTMATSPTGIGTTRKALGSDPSNPTDRTFLPATYCYTCRLFFGRCNRRHLMSEPMAVRLCRKPLTTGLPTTMWANHPGNRPRL
jgi:hypothetical protein